MRNLRLAVLASLFCLAYRVQAQSEPFWDRIVFQSGFSIDGVNVERPNGTRALSPSPLFYNLHLSGAYNLWHSNDTYSLNAEVGMNVAPFIVFSNAGNSEFFFQPAAYLLGRAWGGATKYNEQKVGLGLGVGLTYTYVQLPILVNGRQEYTLTEWFPAPSAIAEVTFNGRSGTYTLRAHFNVTTADTPRDPVLGEELAYENWGIGLLIRMGR